MKVALISGAVSVAVAIFTFFASRRAKAADERSEREILRLSHQLDQDAKEKESLLEARAVVDRYRRPLLASAVELRSRLGNIRHNNFHHYIESRTGRSDLAVLTTLYRIANYFAWRELIARELTYMPYEDDARTKKVVDLMNHVSTQFSSSSLDNDGTYARLMLWKEEQRAIGGLMLNENPRNPVIGFETFTSRFESHFARWLASSGEDLRLPRSASSDRLEAVSSALADLIIELDEERVFQGRP